MKIFVSYAFLDTSTKKFKNFVGQLKFIVKESMLASKKLNITENYYIHTLKFLNKKFDKYSHHCLE